MMGLSHAHGSSGAESIATCWAQLVPAPYSSTSSSARKLPPRRRRSSATTRAITRPRTLTPDSYENALYLWQQGERRVSVLGVAVAALVLVVVLAGAPDDDLVLFDG